MAGRTLQPRLTKSEAILFAERATTEYTTMTVYFFNSRYHVIPTRRKDMIHHEAVVIHTTKNSTQTFRYDEGGGRVREQLVNSRGEVISERYASKSKLPLIRVYKKKQRHSRLDRIRDY